eukprot:g858.t1
MSKPTLMYFDGPGRAEISRLALHAGKIDFVDKRLSFEEFGKLKNNTSTAGPGMRFGSVPIIIHDKLMIAQSQAVALYAAELSLTPQLTKAQRAVDMQYLGLHADVQSAMYKCLFGTDESKEAGKKALPGAATKYVSALERMLPAKGFVHGQSSPSIADLAIFDFVTSKFPGLKALGFDLSSYPKVLAIVAGVRGFPPLKDYLEDESTRRRLEAQEQLRHAQLAKHAKEKQMQQLVSQSLKGDISQNKRITFSDDEEDDTKTSDGKDIANGTVKPAPAKMSSALFSDSEEEESDDENILKSEDDNNISAARFRLRKEYEGEGGRKLFERQMAIDKVTGSDSRFRMDESFVEEGQERADGARDEEDGLDASGMSKTDAENSSVKLQQERDRMMALLQGKFDIKRTEEAAKPQLKTASNRGSSSKDRMPSNVLLQKLSFFSNHSWNAQVVHCFDPTDPRHRELEITHKEISPSITTKTTTTTTKSKIADEKKMQADRAGFATKKNRRATEDWKMKTKQTVPSNKSRFVKMGDTWGDMFISKKDAEATKVMPASDSKTASFKFKFSVDPSETERTSNTERFESQSHSFTAEGDGDKGHTIEVSNVEIADAAVEPRSLSPSSKEEKNNSDKSTGGSERRKASTAAFSFWKGGAKSSDSEDEEEDADQRVFKCSAKGKGSSKVVRSFVSTVSSMSSNTPQANLILARKFSDEDFSSLLVLSEEFGCDALTVLLGTRFAAENTNLACIYSLMDIKLSKDLDLSIADAAYKTAITHGISMPDDCRQFWPFKLVTPSEIHKRIQQLRGERQDDVPGKLKDSPILKEFDSLTERVNLVSKEGESFSLTAKEAGISEYVRTYIAADGPDEESEAEEEAAKVMDIHLSSVTSKAVKCFLAYCNVAKDATECLTSLRSWESKFLDSVPEDDMGEILRGADILQVKPLVVLLLIKVRHFGLAEICDLVGYDRDIDDVDEIGRINDAEKAVGMSLKIRKIPFALLTLVRIRIASGKSKEHVTKIANDCVAVCRVAPPAVAVPVLRLLAKDLCSKSTCAFVEAAKILEFAAARSSSLSDTHNSPAQLMYKAAQQYSKSGRQDDAVRCWRRVEKCEGEIGELARFKLIALSSSKQNDTALARAPASYVRKLYDGYASTFDTQLVLKLKYRTPDVLTDMLRGLANSTSGTQKTWSRCVDLGCGTGLSGLALRSLVDGTMVGVDLSTEMIAMARARQVYDALLVEDIVSFLENSRHADFDLVVSCDVFVYFGELKIVFEAANACMMPGGIFAFSTESLGSVEGIPFRLNRTKRFQHTPAYVEAAAASAGFSKVNVVRGERIRMQGGEPVLGDIFAFRKGLEDAADSGALKEKIDVL